MYRYTRYVLLVLLAGLPVAPTWAADSELEQLRQELELMRQGYESRIQQLESKITELADKQAVTEHKVASRAPAPAPTGQRSGQNDFNPGIAAILNGKVNSYSRDPDTYALPGFQLGGEAGLSSEGLTAEESELSISGNIDDRFFGNLTLGIHQDDGETAVELEEAYIESMGLPNGFGVKTGRFFSEVGYLNRQHSHAWDFADEPLVYRAFLGKQYTDDGVQVRWLAPTDTFLEVGGEYLRGASFPAGGSDNEGKGVATLFAHLGGDVGDSHNWRVGLSGLWADARERSVGDSAHGHVHGGGGAEPSVFAGDSNLWIADVVWKWAPGGNPVERNFKFQAEYFHRQEDGLVSVDDGMEMTDYRGTQNGWYAQVVYQFRPRWRIGARYDQLWSDNRGSDAGVLDEAGLNDDYDPSRFSAMLDYSRNEFNRLRFQYNRDKSRPGSADDQFTIQYLMSFGAHGGHQF
jgi:hypothetical protein